MNTQEWEPGIWNLEHEYMWYGISPECPSQYIAYGVNIATDKVCLLWSKQEVLSTEGDYSWLGGAARERGHAVRVKSTTCDDMVGEQHGLHRGEYLPSLPPSSLLPFLPPSLFPPSLTPSLHDNSNYSTCIRLLEIKATQHNTTQHSTKKDLPWA